MSNTHHTNKYAKPSVIYGRRLQPGDVLESTDMFEDPRGTWESCVVAGSVLKEDSDLCWVRPAPEPPDEPSADEPATFEPGDVVRLKSGGPPMTVSSLPSKSPGDDTERVICAWFDGGTTRVARVQTDVLEKVDGGLLKALIERYHGG